MWERPEGFDTLRELSLSAPSRRQPPPSALPDADERFSPVAPRARQALWGGGRRGSRASPFFLPIASISRASAEPGSLSSRTKLRGRRLQQPQQLRQMTSCGGKFASAWISSRRERFAVQHSATQLELLAQLLEAELTVLAISTGILDSSG